jgi:H+/Na+-translocating ferredoxin:NAD+ oxidoreductase subunit G
MSAPSHAARLALALLLSGGACALSAQAVTQGEALALAFPGAVVERSTAFLDDSQLDQARSLAGGEVEIQSAVVTYYLATAEGESVGVAYFDAARVRTLRQVLMIVVNPDDRVTRIEILSFGEPPEYKAPQGWLGLFEGRDLDEIKLRDDVPNMTGATLTSEATAKAARRVLALHRIIAPFSAGGS